MTPLITFSDLTHTSQGISNISFPLGISLVASKFKKDLNEDAEIDIFKYPEDLGKNLDKKNLLISCFSNYSWNLDISHEFAKQIKTKSPETIIIFGGPNYPKEKDEQKKFLLSHPAIDFYINGEGELSFINLFNRLKELDFNIKKFKGGNLEIENCHYLHNEEIISNDKLSRVENLDEVPSPYLSGLMEKFFDGILIPVIQTTRGCPFKCTYCQEGDNYFDKIKRFSDKRIIGELEYIAENTKVPQLIIADSNFGMYKEDLETCRSINKICEKYNWPKYVDTSLGKNKQCVSEAVSVLKGSVLLSAPVQSTNEEVLKNIKRKNISIKKIIELSKIGHRYNANSLSEIILGLPGDTKDAHFKSMLDMINAEINVVRSHQLLMLPGSEIYNSNQRKKYGIVTCFRLQPRCFGEYTFLGNDFPSAEIDEICIANNTMSFEDYLECRSFDLSIEIFYNNAIFRELTSFLGHENIQASYLIKKIHEKILKSQLKELYSSFIQETKNSLWENKKDLENLIKNREEINKYIIEELRSNEQLKYRAVAFFNMMEELHKIAFSSAKEILNENGIFEEKKDMYLNELFKFSLERKENLLSLNDVKKEEFHYDFFELLEKNFIPNPLDYFKNKKISIEFAHTKKQKEVILSYLKQFGSSMNGLGLILSRSNANKFYREVRKL